MKKVIWLSLFLFSNVSSAQYFNSNAFQLPIISWMGFDSTASFLVADGEAPWPTTDQLQLGMGYQYALSGYKLWWVTSAALSLGYARNYNLPRSNVLTGFNSITGLRYNFLSEYWRPFMMTGIGIFTMFTDPNGAATVQTAGRSYMHLQLGPGLEWIFGDDMSLQLDTGAVMLYDFNKTPRFTYKLSLSYLFYF